MRIQRSFAAVLAAALTVILFPHSFIQAQEAALPSGEEIIRRVEDRDVGLSSELTMAINLTDKGGKTREREMKVFRKFFGDEKRMALFFTAPGNIKGTALLTYDYKDPSKEDDQWLYLPALRKVRRIPPAERGDSFAGTDFSYQDMNSEARAGIDDHTWTTTGTAEIDGRPTYVVEAVPKDKRTADELGYAQATLWIDQELWVLRQAEFKDADGETVKRISLRDYKQVDGIWTPFALEATNLKSGHSTLFTVTGAAFNGDVPDDLFTRHTLEHGI